MKKLKFTEKEDDDGLTKKHIIDIFDDRYADYWLEHKGCDGIVTKVSPLNCGRCQFDEAGRCNSKKGFEFRNIVKVEDITEKATGKDVIDGSGDATRAYAELFMGIARDYIQNDDHLDRNCRMIIMGRAINNLYVSYGVDMQMTYNATLARLETIKDKEK